ncbi:MAG: hypothetical protein RL112_543, partial [Planctomycetota bacterium]
MNTFSLLPLARFGVLATLLATLLAASVHAAPRDWTNNGGNAGRNGQTRAIGPDAPVQAWSGGRQSVI